MRFGHFEGDLIVTLLPGEQVRLEADVVYVDPADTRWIAPKGFISDGASIPRAFWSIVGGPLDGSYRGPAFVHDRYCATQSAPSHDVHRMFYLACRAAGVGALEAKILYAAVRIGGPRWGEDLVEPLPSAVPSDFDLDQAASRDERVGGPAAPPASVLDPNEVATWIEQDDPSLEDIDDYATAAAI